MIKNITIDITQDDITVRKLTSDSGLTIDALAYAAGGRDYSWDDAPHEPYKFDYETDLLEKTVTAEDFNKLGATLCSPCMMINYTAETIGNLEAGAYCALNDPDAWSNLLQAWTEKLQEEGTYGPSASWNKELQAARDDYKDIEYEEWLNGDNSYWPGIIETISKYFTNDRYAGIYDKKSDVYTFTLSPEDAHQLACGCYDEKCNKDFKSRMLDQIENASSARTSKDKATLEKRQAEYAKKADARRAKLEARTITDKTLGELLTDKNITISRHAMGILKEDKKNK